MPVMLRDSTTGPEPHTSTPKWAQSTMAFSLQLELPAVARVLFLAFGVFFFFSKFETNPQGSRRSCIAKQINATPGTGLLFADFLFLFLILFLSPWNVSVLKDFTPKTCVLSRGGKSYYRPGAAY